MACVNAKSNAKNFTQVTSDPLDKIPIPFIFFDLPTLTLSLPYFLLKNAPGLAPT